MTQNSQVLPIPQPRSPLQLQLLPLPGRPQSPAGHRQAGACTLHFHTNAILAHAWCLVLIAEYTQEIVPQQRMWPTSSGQAAASSRLGTHYNLFSQFPVEGHLLQLQLLHTVPCEHLPAWVVSRPVTRKGFCLLDGCAHLTLTALSALLSDASAGSPTLSAAQQGKSLSLQFLFTHFLPE